MNLPQSDCKALKIRSFPPNFPNPGCTLGENLSETVRRKLCLMVQKVDIGDIMPVSVNSNKFSAN